MKLATLNDGSRDGLLILVSRDLSTAHVADAIAPTLQRALDDWGFVGPQLEALAHSLNQGRARQAFQFDPRRCMAPMPRAFQWLRVGVRAPGTGAPDAASDAGTDAAPAPYERAALQWWRGRSDELAGPFDDALFGSEDWDIDLETTVAAVPDDIPLGATPEQCAGRIRLLMLAGDWCLRAPPQGAGFAADAMVHGRPGSVVCPVAVTPDELGDAWRDARIHLPPIVHLNGMRVGATAPSQAQQVDFARPLAELARSSALRAGSVIAVDAAPAGDAPRAAGIAAARAREPGENGGSRSGFVRFGDRIRVEMIDARGVSVFGAIDQNVGRAAA